MTDRSAQTRIRHASRSRGSIRLRSLQLDSSGVSAPTSLCPPRIATPQRPHSPSPRHALAIGRSALRTASISSVPDGTQTLRDPDRDIYVACNAWIDGVSFRIPRSPNGKAWRRAIDTSLLSPCDILGLDEGPTVPNETPYLVAGHSMIVLIAEG